MWGKAVGAIQATLPFTFFFLVHGEIFLPQKVNWFSWYKPNLILKLLLA